MENDNVRVEKEIISPKVRQRSSASIASALTSSGSPAGLPLRPHQHYANLFVFKEVL